MIDLGTIQANVSLETSNFNRSITAALGGISSLAAGFSGKLNSAVAGSQAKILAFTAVVGIAGAELGKYAVKTATDFESMTTRIANNTAMTNAQLGSMRNSILKFSKETGDSFDDLGSAMEHITNQGFKGAAATKILHESMIAAVGTYAKTAEVAGLVARTLADYNMQADKAATVTNTLVRAAQLADTEFGDFAQNTNRAYGTASAYGIAIPQVSAVLAELTRLTGNAYRASTLFDALIQHIVSPSDKARKSLHALALASGDKGLEGAWSAAGIKGKGLIPVLERMGRDSQGQVEILKDLVPAQRGQLALFDLLTSGAGRLNYNQGQLSDTMQGKVKPATIALTREQKTFNAQMDKLSVSIQEQFLPAGGKLAASLEKLMPDFAAVATFAAKALDAFAGLPRPVQAAAAAFVALAGGLTAVAAAAKVLGVSSVGAGLLGRLGVGAGAGAAEGAAVGGAGAGAAAVGGFLPFVGAAVLGGFGAAKLGTWLGHKYYDKPASVFGGRPPLDMQAFAGRQEYDFDKSMGLAPGTVPPGGLPAAAFRVVPHGHFHIPYVDPDAVARHGAAVLKRYKKAMAEGSKRKTESGAHMILAGLRDLGFAGPLDSAAAGMRNFRQSMGLIDAPGARGSGQGLTPEARFRIAAGFAPTGLLPGESVGLRNKAMGMGISPETFDAVFSSLKSRLIHSLGLLSESASAALEKRTAKQLAAEQAREAKLAAAQTKRLAQESARNDARIAAMRAAHERAALRQSGAINFLNMQAALSEERGNPGAAQRLRARSALMRGDVGVGQSLAAGEINIPQARREFAMLDKLFQSHLANIDRAEREQRARTQDAVMRDALKLHQIDLREYLKYLRERLRLFGEELATETEAQRQATMKQMEAMKDAIKGARQQGASRNGPDSQYGVVGYMNKISASLHAFNKGSHLLGKNFMTFMDKLTNTVSDVSAAVASGGSNIVADMAAVGDILGLIGGLFNHHKPHYRTQAYVVTNAGVAGGSPAGGYRHSASVMVHIHGDVHVAGEGDMEKLGQKIGWHVASQLQARPGT